MNRRMLVVMCFLCVTLTQTLFAQQQVKLKAALDEVRAVYGTKFSYEEHLLDNVYVNFKRPLTKSAPVESVLKELLYNKGFLFLYVQENYYTIIKDNRRPQTSDAPAEDNTFRLPPPEYVQTITGTVTDSEGHPLTGVTVIPEGLGVRMGVSSSSDGRYTIRLTEKTEALVFTFIGMVPMKINIGDKAVINVQMQSDLHQLREVNVVSTGYQTLPKERATGSFGQITQKDIKSVPSVDLMERLQGLVPGARFDPRTNTISIRGINTLSATTGSTPLIVIDGFPAVEQNLTTRLNSNTTGGAILSRYNPEDIESITILKDAAATSIWGAKAANGVIVITTKKGRKNSSQLNFNTNLSTSAPANLDNLNRMTTPQYIELEKEMKDLGYFTDPLIWDNSWMTFNQNKPVSESLEWMFKVDRGTATAQQRDSALAALGKLDNRKQIRDLLMQHATSQQYNLSFSGGGQNSTYYISTNYTKDVPVFKSNKGESYFVTANMSNDLFNNKVTINTGINYSYSSSVSNTAAVNAISNSRLGLRPYEMLQDATGHPIARSIDFRDEVAADFLSKGYLPWTYSPLQELNYGNINTKENHFRFTADINTKITKWANASVSGILQRNIGEDINLQELNSYDTRTLINGATTIGSNGRLVYGIPFGGKMINSNRTSFNYGLRGQLNVNKSWSDKYNLNALAGAEIREDQGTRYQQTRYGFDEDTYSSSSWDPNASYQTVQGWTSMLGFSDGSITKSINRFLSYYGNAAFSMLNNRYIASASVRFDDFSLAGASRGKRARPLWSAGLKWDVTAEDFMKDVTWLNKLNLRLTYGTGGSIPTSATNAAILNLRGLDPVTREPYGDVLSPANDKVSWELTKTWNLGVDLGFFHNRLFVSADAYRKKTSDILWTFPINSTYGWTSLQYNAASMKGHGYELGIRGEIIRSKHFSWASTFNFAYNTNEVTDSRFNPPTSSMAVNSSSPIVGMPTDYMYAYRWAGLDNKGRSQVYNKEGKIITADMGNNQITAQDLVYMGRTTPPYFGGFFNDFTYRSFSIGVRINYEMGHVFRRLSIENYPDYATSNYLGLIGTQRDLALRWRKPGDEAFTNVPGLPNVTTNSSNRYKSSNLLVESASHIRLQQISLGYQVPSQLLSRMAVKSLGLSMSARNLGIIWKKNKAGVDPSYINGTNYNNLPPATSYFMSLNASF
ncbi:SusC/RagA family TonB-linked outer membrane protein [Chitinophaga ginsengisoli]|uniref:TonB-linked SusC/RagA family outer membrane protein n=1 Tax=Chitinophaga ginsengisoli TaxID=363837 RepID=A0A2P8GLX9_9BACT|nr:SusC/RagA family TonB-linked outer membrane protein [Chitinophaga ginsengisoli]PSL34972.1 TonB-linked SusC/RagA family outer membrane protein [Chitinophaga ginsengisoli]